MLKLCIACSSKVAASSRTCSCGHVFSPETRRIGGKRFSGYRLGTTRRQSKSTSREERRKKANPSAQLEKKERKPILCPSLKSHKTMRLKTTFSLHKNLKKDKHQLSKENQTKAKERNLRRIVQVLSSPEKRLKLSLALAEINRRLAGQIQIWKMLPCQTG
ncbi:uncharacterized protein LOC141896868 [Acropora palmata]|uniref:uncharacterized protein LOC141896868 n=1 Tax=Acropora palmata TaxID=6131 RepID=UPI003DA152CD